MKEASVIEISDSCQPQIGRKFNMTTVFSVVFGVITYVIVVLSVIMLLYNPTAPDPYGAVLHKRDIVYNCIPSGYNCVSQKRLSTTVFLSMFLGVFGADRFYLGYIGMGVGKIITVGGFGIWALVDMCLEIAQAVPDSNGCYLVN